MKDIFSMISEIPAVKEFRKEARSGKDLYTKMCKDLLGDLIEKENDYNETQAGDPNTVIHHKGMYENSLSLDTTEQYVIDICTLLYPSGKHSRLIFTVYDKNGNRVTAAILSHEVLQAYLDGLDL